MSGGAEGKLKQITDVAAPWAHGAATIHPIPCE